MDADYIQEVADSYQENQEIKASQGQELIEGTLQKMEIDKAAQDAAEIQSAGELANMRELAASGRGPVAQGVDFSSMDAFINSVPSSAILQAGIPMDEFANGMISLNNLISQYNANVNQFGANSSQAQNVMNQISSLSPSLISAMASNLLAANNIL